jgi:hypothetical protein
MYRLVRAAMSVYPPPPPSRVTSFLFMFSLFFFFFSSSSPSPPPPGNGELVARFPCDTNASPASTTTVPNDFKKHPKTASAVGLGGYDVALTRRRSRVRVPNCVLFSRARCSTRSKCSEAPCGFPPRRLVLFHVVIGLWFIPDAQVVVVVFLYFLTPFTVFTCVVFLGYSSYFLATPLLWTCYGRKKRKAKTNESVWGAQICLPQLL